MPEPSSGNSVTRSEEESLVLVVVDKMPAANKPVLPPLQTPKSASFPSDLLKTPLSGVGCVIKQEEDLKTPITPPSAYTDFLKALTPVLTSPHPLSALPRSLSSDDSSGRNTPTSEPSTSSSFSCRCESIKSPNGAPPTPPSAFAQTRPNSASLRRLRIPQSPLQPAPLQTPGSAQSPMSASISRSPFSPADWNLDSNGHRYFEAPRSGCIRPVSVRSVVTRTVTYKRTALDPAPKGKKRKLDTPEMPPPPAVSASTAVV